MDLRTNIGLMNQRLAHRGPDDMGVWIDDSQNLALGHTRLSILDLSQAGHQPMQDAATGNMIVFNGEIFNYRLLNAEYLKDEKFQSSSDTETILKLYNKFGLDMIEKLNGMFAFTLYDKKKEELILARDRPGKKPLYYTNMSGNFVFASELKAMFEVEGIRKEVDEKVLYDFLTFNTVAAPHSMFKDIYKFKPGHVMVVDKNGVKSYDKFYKTTYVPLQFQTEKEVEDQVFNKLKESVQLRMISDVPVGAFLSGGVDSSAIVALMRENTDNEIKTFTVGFEGQPDYNELVYAEQMSKRYHTNHYVKTITAADIIDFIPKITEIYDEPQADTTAIPIYFISQLAQNENIKVVLNGDGPDELFSGYKNYARYVKTNRQFKRAEKAPRFLKQLASNIISKANKGGPLFEMTNRLAKGQDLYWPGAAGLKEGIKQDLLSNEFKQKINGHSSYNYVKELKRDYDSYLNGSPYDYVNWLCYSGYRNAVTERFLFRADRLGMANSIEARSPFLNHEMVELALSIPGSLKIKDGVNKYILKKSLERILPHEILYRKKMGFNLPIREWASETIYNEVKTNISAFSKNVNIFNVEKVNDQLKLLKQGKTEYTNTVWTIYFIMNWYKRWL